MIDEQNILEQLPKEMFEAKRIILEEASSTEKLLISAQLNFFLVLVSLLMIINSLIFTLYSKEVNLVFLSISFFLSLISIIIIISYIRETIDRFANINNSSTRDGLSEIENILNGYSELVNEKITKIDFFNYLKNIRKVEIFLRKIV